MGWKTELQDAQFRGIPFHVVSIADIGGKALVIHEYPYRAGGAVEDMGCTARHIPVKAAFWGVEYASKLKQFIDALETPGIGELVHPVFGVVPVAIKSWSIAQGAEQPDYAEVSFEAVVSALDTSFFKERSQQSIVEQAVEVLRASTVQLQEQADVQFKEAVTRPRGFAEQGALIQQLIDTIALYSSNRYGSQSEPLFLQKPEIFSTELRAAQKSWAIDAPKSPFLERFIVLSNAFPKWDVLHGLEGLKTYYNTSWLEWSPLWISGDKPGVSSPVPAMPLEHPIKEIEPVQMKRVCTSKTIVSTYVMLSQTCVFIDELQHMLGVEFYGEPPKLLPHDVPTAIRNARLRIQDCISAVRQTMPEEAVYSLVETLRTLAEGIQNLGEGVESNTQKCIPYYVQHEESMSLLAHRLYGNARRSRELLKVNPHIRNPNMLAVGQMVYVYADGLSTEDVSL